MRFIESVARERLHELEYCVGLFLCVSLFECAFREFFVLGLHHRGLFLSHRFTQYVGFTKGVTAKRLGDQHHLVLVNEDAIGRFKQLS